eukprot:TRINITY_DN3763_c0_g1_i1.p1 TRINITY_DN3763_c0_g1~~TRINITY_DN3763_c0_g1_i1.p1  ORF type:complete len:650 (-),score=121.66 TRINITY_DN3763_c0_g1_i1:67-2016(-)
MLGCAGATDYGVYGCAGGAPSAALEYVRDSKGLMTASAFPYPDSAFTSGQTPSCAAVTGSVATVSAVTTFAVDEGEGVMDQLLYAGSALAVAINAEPLQSYTGGVLPALACDSAAPANHAVVLTGWGVDSTSGAKYWTFQNSWGQNWGEAGYFRLERGAGACGILSYPASVAVSPSATACTAASCPRGYNCTRGVCVPAASCVPKAAGDACDNRTCGTASDGCGAAVVCGQCDAAGTTCDYAAGKCMPTGVWTNFARGSRSFTFDTATDTVTYHGNTTAKPGKAVASKQWEGFAWNASASLASGDHTAFSAVVSAKSGVVALGLRLGQTTGARDGLYWSLNLDAQTATFATVYQGKDVVLHSVPLAGWNSTEGAQNLLAVTLTLNISSYGFLSMAHVNGVAQAEDPAAMVPVTKMYVPAAGLAYVLATGTTPITLASPLLATYTSLMLTTTTPENCTTAPSLLRAYAAALLSVPAACVIFGAPVSTCANVTTSFAVAVADCPFHRLLDGAVPTAVSSYQMAAALRDTTAAGGWPGVASAQIVADIVPSMELDPGSAGMKGGVIIAIVLGVGFGCTMAVLAVLFAAGWVSAWYATLPEPQEPVPADFRPRNPLRKALYKIHASKGERRPLDPEAASPRPSAEADAEVHAE